MKPAEKNPQTQPAASPPNPERRRFLRNALFAGAALATGCKSENPYPEKKETLVQNRGISIGSSTLTLDNCSGEGESPSAYFSIRKQGKEGVASTISMLVPGYFKMNGGGYEYEIYAESVSCNSVPKSANISIINKSPTPQASEGSRGFSTAGDISLIGAAAAFIGALILAVSHRGRESQQEDGFQLPPKRNY